ncbi:unnamed protein product [Moneuplotes crassus]|uniref:Uncharacterized protein n=1 Tax=Euplotes crassus TaxID=5936 RepID=A0AAD1Y041_EUPCR|nr:unnamed protein product [Moneuplotes crassus]
MLVYSLVPIMITCSMTIWSRTLKGVFFKSMVESLVILYCFPATCTIANVS